MYFLLASRALFTDMHFWCLVIYKITEQNLCLLTWHSQPCSVAGHELIKIYFPCKLTARLFLCLFGCVGGREDYSRKVLFALNSQLSGKHEAQSVCIETRVIVAS
jgi:hypothetical protein